MQAQLGTVACPLMDDSCCHDADLMLHVHTLVVVSLQSFADCSVYSVQEYVASITEVLPADARVALEASGADDRNGSAVSQIGTHLKRKVYLATHQTENKRVRLDNAPASAGENACNTTDQTLAAQS